MDGYLVERQGWTGATKEDNHPFPTGEPLLPRRRPGPSQNVRYVAVLESGGWEPASLFPRPPHAGTLVIGHSHQARRFEGFGTHIEQRSGKHALCGRSHHRAISGTHGRCTAFLVPAATEVSASALRRIAYLAFVHRHTAHSALVLVHIAALGGRSGVLAFILEFGVAWVTRLHVRC